jgi:hypothetical protein
MKMLNMNWKRYWLCSVVVIVVRGIIAFTLFSFVFSSVFDQELPGARPEGEELHEAGLLSMLTWAFAFTYVFIRGYQNKGWIEGVRFGFVVWMFYFIPMLTGYWAYFKLPADWVMASIVIGFAESLGAGIVTSLIYKPKLI